MSNYKLLSTREMRAKGYTLAPTRHHGEPSLCNQCKAEIEWWITPNNKSVPFDPADRDDIQRTCHFATCPATKFKSEGTYPANTIAELADIKRIIVAEYKRDHEGDAGYQAPDHKINWLYKKLAEARLELATKGKR